MSDTVVVSTAARPLNGAISGGAAILGTYIAKQYNLDDGAPLIGMAASAFLATLGDWSRGILAEGAVHPLAKLPLMLFSRLG